MGGQTIVTSTNFLSLLLHRQLKWLIYTLIYLPSAAFGAETGTPYVSNYADFGDVKIHYVTTDQFNNPDKKDQPLMLFLHGFPHFWYSWKSQLSAFDDDFRVVAMDGRGYNLSSKPQHISDYKISKLVEDVNQLSKQLAPNQKIILIGHDWGGCLAWAFAQKYPNKVDKLIVENAPPLNLLLQFLQTHEEQRQASSYMTRIKSQQGLESLIAEDYALMVRLFDRLIAQGLFTDHDITMYKQAWSQPKAMESSINWYRANLPHPDDISEADFWPQREARIDGVSALLIWGEDEKVFSQDFLTVIPQYVENVRIEIFPNTGHSPSTEKADLFNQVMRDFIGDN
jgi:pimeloyl-ACP methyl ester carboxylesterase